ncbi:MAG: hypothetical protein QXJ59_06425 [Thermofilaceae archaeon]
MRGVSPVLATTILVGLTITLFAVAAFLLLQAGGLLAEKSAGVAEQLAFTAVYALKEDSGWTIVLAIENNGLAPIEVKQVFVNGLPTDYCAGILEGGGASRVEPREVGTVSLKLVEGGGCGNSRFFTGSIVEVSLLTGGGNRFSTLVTLP